MRTVRFYCESIEPISELDPVESGHLTRVLRLDVGAAVELFDGKGTLAQGIVEQVQKQHVTVGVTEQTLVTPPAGKIILAVSFAKGQRFDWLVEKCTELGADHITAVRFDRTVKLGSTAGLKRLSKITIAAAKQCGRLFLPELSGPENLKQTLDILQSRYPESRLLYGSPDAVPLADVIDLPLKTDTIVCIGPEGGFSEAETCHLQSQEAVPVSISPNTLRVETAAAAFCALLRQM